MALDYPRTITHLRRTSLAYLLVNYLHPICCPKQLMWEDGVQPNLVTLRSALIALENATPPSQKNEGRISPVPSPSSSTLTPTPTATLEAAKDSPSNFDPSETESDRSETKKKKLQELIRSPTTSPWELALSLLQKMAGGMEGGVFPGPRDFSAGLTTAWLGGVGRSSVAEVRRFFVCILI